MAAAAPMPWGENRKEASRVGVCRTLPESARLRTEYEPFPVPYPLPFRILREGSVAVRRFFPFDPASESDLAARAGQLEGAWDERRRGPVARALGAYLRRIGPRPAQERALERLASPGALAVVTGQQAGLFTGAAFTAWKAVTAIRLAAALERQLGRPVVPVFWIASDDHDYHEVAEAWTVDGSGCRLRLHLPPAPSRRSAGDIPVPAAAGRLIDAFSAAVGGGVRAEGVREMLRVTWQASRGGSLADWFARQMTALFGDHGLVLLDPMTPEFRELALPTLLRAVHAAPAVSRCLRDGAAEMESAGLSPPLAVEEGHLHVFHYAGGVGGPRLALFRQGDQVTTRGGEVAWRWSELLTRMEAAPREFSPDAVVRPAVECDLLPVLVHVCGPGEAAYLAQARRVWEVLGVSPPVLAPRAGLTVVPEEERDLLARLRVSIHDLWFDGDGAIQRFASARSPLDVRVRFAAERQAIRERYEALIRDLSAVSPGLAEVGASNLARVLWQLGYLERKAMQHERRRERVAVAALRAAREWLFPGGRLQEAILCFPALLARAGLGLVDALVSTAPVEPGDAVAHYLVHVVY
jgi:bacillithiol biosynthesis cysteine-adding enzyme BshC